MQETSLELLGLRAQIEKLRHSIDTLETENAKLNSEASCHKEEVGGLTKKIEEIKNENYKLDKNLLSLEETHEKLLDEFDKIKNEKKDRDDKILELEKQVGSQKSELAGAYEGIKKQKKNKQRKSKLTECLSKSRTENKGLVSNIKSLEEQNAGLKKRLDEMERKSETLRHHNELLSSNGIKKIQMKDEDQSSDNSTNENFSEDKREEPLFKLETKHAKLLHDFEEMKNKNKGRDYKVLELEKKFGSQNLELARVHDEITELSKAYEEIETQKENEQCMNTLAERLLQSHIEAKELKSNVASVEAQNADYKNRLDEMEIKCEILHLHNKILSLNGGKNYL